MKNIKKITYLGAIALLAGNLQVRSMEPVKKAPLKRSMPWTHQTLPIIARQMVLDLPLLNPGASLPTKIQYFQKYGDTLRALSALIQRWDFRPTSELAQIIKNREINIEADDESTALKIKDLLGDYLYEIAKFNNQPKTMQWLLDQKLANPQTNFFQRTFQIALNQQPFNYADAKFWFAFGASADAQDNNGMTALMRRAQLDGEEGIVQMNFLLEQDANPNLKNKEGKTARDLARHNSSKVELLRKFGGY